MDRIVDNFMNDEDGFLQHATVRELIRLERYFQAKAEEALTPQEHEYFMGRVQQMAMQAAVHA